MHEPSTNRWAGQRPTASAAGATRGCAACKVPPRRLSRHSVSGATTLKARCAVGLYAAAAAFFGATCWVSYARWANFEYRTFDLAYYVQAIWQLNHGRFDVSVEHVPLLGNHVEPIVILIAPLFVLLQHPMLFVVVQNVALASMAPVGFSLAKRLGVEVRGAALFGLALLLTPATGYIALHEFHPEAFTAPFLLLMLHARAAGRIGRHWSWFAAVLACKENMALVLAAYCAVNLIMERRRPIGELRNWYAWPLAVSIGWFVLCTKVITPALNSGDIDYLALYSHLGHSAGDIVTNAFRQPQRLLASLWQSAGSGNLIWALLLPFLALPILRLRWLAVACPILLQHLLSWRSSEWTIYFHYAAPLLPLFWIAMVEVIARLQSGESRIPSLARNALPLLVVLACVTGQAWLGPAPAMASTAARWSVTKPDRDRKNAFMSVIPPNASVTAPLPYLSHLATREKLYSLHYVLKGLKTLSRAAFEPPPATDFVFIDYDDSATFDADAGYYHPAMKTVDGRVIPSSDQLLHEFLRRASWTASSTDELTLLRQGKVAPVMLPSDLAATPVLQLGTGTALTTIAKSGDELTAQGLEMRMNWTFQDPRDVFPWMFLKLTPRSGGKIIIIPKGLCAPEATAGPYQESWHVTSGQIPQGRYSVEALFVDNAKRIWADKSAQRDSQTPFLAPVIPLGNLNVTAGKDPSRK